MQSHQGRPQVKGLCKGFNGDIQHFAAVFYTMHTQMTYGDNEHTATTRSNRGER